MRGACIDIGSNTTRLLVADMDSERLVPVAQDRVFTHIGRGRPAGGAISPDKIAEVTEVAVRQLRQARELGAAEVRAVATAAIRWAGNGAELVAAVRAACGLEVVILSEEEEARLAFLGAASTLDLAPSTVLGVVDVGGGSTELAVGCKPDSISWSASLRLGSGGLAHDCLGSDPPSARELGAARLRVRLAFDALDVPQPEYAVAVGGSAASLRLLAGRVLDAAGLARALDELAASSVADVAARFEIDPERVRLAPAGLLILQAVSERFGKPLNVSGGGLREGVLLEICGG